MKQETTKLRNKDTGIIREARIASGHLQLWEPALEDWVDYDDLDDLARFWEYYEEPKTYWFINSCGEIESRTENKQPAVENMHKQFGNYFETEEEAEKAKKKLEALTRLEDKGIVLDSFEGAEICENRYRITFSVRCDRYWSDRLHSMEKDLYLIFGGEE